MVAALNPTCPECGVALARGARFCHRCGWDSRNPAAGVAVVTASAAYGRPAWKRRTMAVFTYLTLAIIAALLLWPGGGSAGAVLPGTLAPDFSLKTLEVQTVTLSDLRGKAVMINFWATWCPPCRAEMPALQAVAGRYRDQGLVLLAINLDESPATIRSFLERNQIQVTVLLDPGQHVTTRYGILPLPTTFFIKPDGVVLTKVEGEMDAGRVEAEARKLLGL